MRRPGTAAEWRRHARQQIRIEMTLLDWRFADLAKALQSIGVAENEVNLRNRVARGRFSAVLFLQCLTAMGVERIDLPPPPTTTPTPDEGTGGDGRTE